jgi:hypothetical protein
MEVEILFLFLLLLLLLLLLEQMAPILDFSVNSIQASLHGCMEAFSMETNFALLSSTYNGRYSAWEPLIEPCDTKVRSVCLCFKANKMPWAVSFFQVYIFI